MGCWQTEPMHYKHKLFLYGLSQSLPIRESDVKFLDSFQKWALFCGPICLPLCPSQDTDPLTSTVFFSFVFFRKLLFFFFNNHSQNQNQTHGPHIVIISPPFFFFFKLIYFNRSINVIITQPWHLSSYIFHSTKNNLRWAKLTIQSGPFQISAVVFCLAKLT